MHDAAGMQVALVDDDPPDGAFLLDLERLDSEVAREAALEKLAYRFDRDLRLLLGHGGAH